MSNRSVALPIYEEWIDAAANIVDTGVAHDLDLAGIGIYLNLANGTAVRKYRYVHLVIFHDGEAVLEFLRQRVVGCLLRQLDEIERAIAPRRRKSAVPEVDLVRCRIENNGGNTLAVGDQ